jgi:hypothetical protein
VWGSKPCELMHVSSFFCELHSSAATRLFGTEGNTWRWICVACHDVTSLSVGKEGLHTVLKCVAVIS